LFASFFVASKSVVQTKSLGARLALMVSLHNYVCLLPACALLLPFLSLSDFFLLPGVHGNVYLWPMPQVVEWGSGPAILLSRDFHFQSPENAVLDKAVVEYKELIRTERWLPIHRTEEEEKEEEEEEEEETLVIVESMEALVVLESLIIVVLDLEADLQHGVDESYTIEVPESSLAVVGTGVRSAPSSLSASILAATVWGALHGLETFSQLIHRGTSPETSLELFIDHGVYIRDQPNFPHRGLLLDTARNFYPVESILRTIRVMAYNKLNVFHWHITDSHSFPLELFKEPELAKKGAYSERHRYSHMDVKRVLEYATQHGVRIIPELDMPGHTGSWSGAYPEVVTCHDQFWLQPGAPWGLRMASEPGWPGQLNPLHPLTYKVVKNLVEEVASLFPDNFFHGGGDEVNPNCWNNSLDIQGVT
jgi:hexosaminidase